MTTARTRLRPLADADSWVVEDGGRGLGAEPLRVLAARALEHGPTPSLVAVVPPDDCAAVRTAERAGFTLVGETDEGVELVAPRVEVCRSPFDPATRGRVLDLWCATNEAGGAVGFLPGAPRDRVSEALAAHEEQLAAGSAVAVLLHEPEGALVGLGLWVGDPNPLFAHGRTAYRVMTDPDRRGRNLGRLLMAAMHRVARGDGVEVVQLVVRSGLGLSRFYERSGYREVGRVPGTIRVAPGDDRDSVFLARRLDDRPLEPDGRP